MFSSGQGAIRRRPFSPGSNTQTSKDEACRFDGSVRTARLRGIAALLAVCLAAAGCAETSPRSRAEPRAPAVTQTVRHFAGSPLAAPSQSPGAARTNDAGDSANALQVRASFFALESLPDVTVVATDPLLRHARLIADTSATEPVLATSKLAAGARVGAVVDAESFCVRLERDTGAVRVGALRGALPPGVTVSLALTGRIARRDALYGNLRQRSAVEVYRAEEERGDTARITFALVLDSVAGHAGDTPRVQAVRQERVVLEESAFRRRHARMFFFRSPFDTCRILAAVIELAPPPSEESPDMAVHAEAFSRCVADLAAVNGDVREESRSRRTRRKLLPAPLDGAAISSALEALALRGTQRDALLYLAEVGGAPLASDLAITGEDDVIAGVARDVLGGTADRTLEVRGESIGWALERAAFLTLTARLSQKRIDPALQFLLVAHAGEIGRHALNLELLVSGSKDLDSLETRLIEENFIYLQDTSVAARQRAFRWLKEQGRAPAGYDPLAAARERRAALSRAASRRPEEATAGESTREPR